MVELLRRLVEAESPSTDKQALDRLGRELARQFESLGGVITPYRQEHAGDHLQANFGGASDDKPVLLLGHFDTVWEVGALQRMPWRVADGRAWGPGSFDMKSGIVIMLYALRALRELRGGVPRPVSVLLVTDEEIGSNSSRPITESLAKQSAAVLVCEPAQGRDGALKTARKGVGEYTVKVTGRAAHSGLDFEKGASAILELARQLGVIEKFTDLARGITVNPGVIRGGTRSNVIAAEAVAEVDARVTRLADAAELDARFRALKPFNPACKVEVTGGFNRPPLERTDAVARLYELARGIAEELGWKLGEAAVGGGSDGNFTAALGIPTLDGLGGVGEGAHAQNESVIIEELPRRAALLAGLIERVRNS
jgi:glutamate carboxypeptidase